MDREARSRLKSVITQARQLLEEDIRAQLKRLGMEEGGKTVPAGRLAHLGPEDKELRDKILLAIHKEQIRNVKRGEAYDRYVRHVGFTYLNRLAALRAMEVRKLIKETVIRRDQYAGMSRREYEFSEREGLSDRAEITKRSLLEAFNEVSQEIKILFDINDEYSLLFPSPRTLDKLTSLLGEEVPQEDWCEEAIIGWIYQYYNSDARSEFRKNRRKPRPDDVPVISQFYTPRWLVRALIDNTLGRLWLEMKGRMPKPGESEAPSKERLRKPQGETVDEYCSYLIPVKNPSSRNMKSVREIRVLDPACGSGHFLVYAFNVLYRMYLEDDSETPRAEIPKLIVENNLCGIDVDLRAVQLAALSLYLKAKEYNRDIKIERMNIVCADVRITDGDLQKKFISRLEHDVDLQRIFAKLFAEFEYTYDVGSLLKVRTPFEKLLEERRKGVQTKFHPKIIGQSSLSKKGGVGGQSELSIKEVERGTLVKPAVTLEEMLGSLLEFEKEGMEKKDMGTMLFAGEAEKSIGLLSLLSQRYDVIVMNPPHGRVPSKTKEYLNDHYPKTKSDYYSAFLQQAVDLCKYDGFISALTGRSLLITKSFQWVREKLLPDNAPPEIVLDLGFYMIEEAHARYAALTLKRLSKNDSRSAKQEKIRFIRLTNFKWDEKRSEFEKAILNFDKNENCYTASLVELERIPRTPYTYWAPDVLRNIFQKHPPLDRDLARKVGTSKIADVKQGLSTADKARFERFWWEIPPSQIAMSREETFEQKKWVPFSNEFYLFYFYSNSPVVVNWEKDGEEIRNFVNAVIRNERFYFRSGLTWSAVLQRTQLGSLWRIRRIPFRVLTNGTIFGCYAQGVIFDFKKAWILLAICCSRLIFAVSRIISAENKQGTTDTALLPIALPSESSGNKLSSLAKEAYDILREWDTGNESSTIFVKPWILQVKEFSLNDKPKTGHPFAQEFEWSSWPSLIHVRNMSNITNDSLHQLANLCEKRHDFLNARLREILGEIDNEVYALYDISNEERRLIEQELELQQIGNVDVESAVKLIEDMELADHVKRLISFYTKKIVDSGTDGIVPLARGSSCNLYDRIHKYMKDDFGEKNASQIERELSSILGKSLEEWILEDYFDFHETVYRNCPIYWHMTSRNFSSQRGSLGAFNCLINYHKLGKDIIPKIRVKREYLKGILDGAKWKTDRLRRELQAARESGDKKRERQIQGECEGALDELNELQAFDAKLAEVSSPREKPTKLDEDASWLERKIAEVRDDGWNPVLDYGVRVNIEPLKEAGLLHRAAERVK